MKEKHSLFRLIVSVLCWLSLSGMELPAREIKQTQADSYTRYELLDPATQSFRIYYDVSTTAAGALTNC